MALPSAVQSVLDLFKGPLQGVRFADIDAAALGQVAAEVEAAASEVERQEATLAELRQSLASREEALLALAQQALAYARVYAENNDEQLLAELDGIKLNTGKPGGAVQPRGMKPRKSAAKVASGAADSAGGEAANGEAANGEAASADAGAEAAAGEDAASGEARPRPEASDAPPVHGGKRGRARAVEATPG